MNIAAAAAVDEGNKRRCYLSASLVLAAALAIGYAVYRYGMVPYILNGAMDVVPESVLHGIVLFVLLLGGALALAVYPAGSPMTGFLFGLALALCIFVPLVMMLKSCLPVASVTVAWWALCLSGASALAVYASRNWIIIPQK